MIIIIVNKLNIKGFAIMDKGKARIRSPWIDIGKAIGIILVVVGHNSFIFMNHHFVLRMITSFHVPLFFALSGATIKTDDTWQKVIARSLSLIWIYFATAIISIPLLSLRAETVQPSIINILQGILYGSGWNLHPVPLWFLPCLTIAVPIAWIVIRSVSNALKIESVIIPVIAVVGVLFAYINSLLINRTPYDLLFKYDWGNFIQSGGFWSIDLVFVGAGYVLLGWAVAKVLSKKPPLWLVVMSILFFVGSFMFIMPVTSLYDRLMQPSFGSILISTLGIFTAFMLFRISEKCPSWVLMIGAATLPILVTHQLLQKKCMIILGHLLGENTFVVFVISILLAVGLPTILDRFFFRKNIIGSLMFYPRKLIRIKSNIT